MEVKNNKNTTWNRSELNTTSSNHKTPHGSQKQQLTNNLETPKLVTQLLKVAIKNLPL